MKELIPAKFGLHGSLVVPGDKSISHRAIMLGALSTGITTIHHFLSGQDCLSTIQAFRDLGVQIDVHNDIVTVHGHGISSLQQCPHALNMGNSGTTTRLMMGILAGRPFSTSLIGDNSLQKRPMKRVSVPLKEFGGEVELTPRGTLPATVVGHHLHHADYQLTVASAQVKSALIFAALQADGVSHLQELLPTRDHTEIMLRQFGAEIQSDGLTITVHPHPALTGQTVEVPGDISSAAFFLVAATIVPGSALTLQHVNLNPTRTGILRVLQKMGAKMTVSHLPSAGEPLGNISIASSHLQPIQVGAQEVPALIDELPLVALLSACADGTSTITGAQELRIKETDRIKTVATELRKFGVAVEELPDGMVIHGQPHWQIRNPNLNSYGDHRIGMMDAIAALKTAHPLQLANEEAVAVSYPTLFNDLAQLCRGE